MKTIQTTSVGDFLAKETVFSSLTTNKNCIFAQQSNKEYQA